MPFIVEYESVKEGVPAVVRVALNADTLEMALTEMAALHLDPGGEVRGKLVEVSPQVWAETPSAPDIWEAPQKTIGPRARRYERLGGWICTGFILAFAVVFLFGGPRWLASLLLAPAFLAYTLTVVLRSRRQWLEG